MFHDPTTAGVDAFAQHNFDEHVNFVHPPVPVLPRIVNFFTRDEPMARSVFVFPMWAAQPWYRALLRMCTHVYELPYAGNDCFEKVHSFPTQPYAKSHAWRYAVGFRNMVPTVALSYKRLQ